MSPPLLSCTEWFYVLSVLFQYSHRLHVGRIYSKMTHPLYEEMKWSLAQIQIEVLLKRIVLKSLFDKVKTQT